MLFQDPLRNSPLIQGHFFCKSHCTSFSVNHISISDSHPSSKTVPIYIHSISIHTWLKHTFQQSVAIKFHKCHLPEFQITFSHTLPYYSSFTLESSRSAEALLYCSLTENRTKMRMLVYHLPFCFMTCSTMFTKPESASFLFSPAWAECRHSSFLSSRKRNWH